TSIPPWHCARPAMWSACIPFKWVSCSRACERSAICAWCRATAFAFRRLERRLHGPPPRRRHRRPYGERVSRPRGGRRVPLHHAAAGGRSSQAPVRRRLLGGRRLAKKKTPQASPHHRDQVGKRCVARRVLILVENLPSPFDRRVWQEASTLRDAGYLVSIICPTGKGYEKKYEQIDDIDIWRYQLPAEAEGALGYLIEYSAALFWTFLLSWRVLLGRGFDVVHACNPPDLFFLIGNFFKLFGKKFVFDHHDANPELYEAKFGRRDFLWKAMCLLERLTFRFADVSIATNNSYRRIAIERGGMPPERVFVVRSGPSLERLKIVPPRQDLKRGKKYLVGYVGVMGKQEGIDLLL